MSTYPVHFSTVADKNNLRLFGGKTTLPICVLPIVMNGVRFYCEIATTIFNKNPAHSQHVEKGKEGGISSNIEYVPYFNNN